MNEQPSSSTTSPASSTPQTSLTQHYDKFLDCVHCGLCLPACPTYSELGLEMDSPRGRIYLMRAYADGRIDMTDNFVEHIDLCLDCRACETACPAGVHYGSLVELTRAEIAKKRPKSRREKQLRDFVFKRLLPSSDLLSLMFLPLRVYQGLGIQSLVRRTGLVKLLPAKLQEMEAMLPRLPSRSKKKRLNPVIQAKDTPRHRVGMISGCIMNEMFTHINVATARVLAENGCEVVIPNTQTCCGALQVHSGERETAEELARRNIEAFEQTDVEVIIINAAGCGAQLKEYDELLENDPDFSDRAKAFSKKVRDISEFLAEIPLNKEMGPVNARVAYHDACHLAHGQKIREQPRALLSQIPGLELVDLPESDWCCGSAGIYNILQPEMANRLMDRKVNHVNQVAPDIVATGNPGCILQIQNGLNKSQQQIEVLHPVQLLDHAYRAAKNRPKRRTARR